MKAVKVAILEDNVEIRQGFELFVRLNPAFELIGSFDKPSEFIRSFEATAPDVAVVDIHLPEMSGIECIMKLKPKYGQCQFLICTVYDDDDHIYKALCAGATGYILKKNSPAEFTQAILDIHGGGSPMSMQISRRVVASFQQKQQILQEQQQLSPREREILELLSKGLRYKEIADQLFISIETVRTHIRNIYEKLQVQSRTEALNKAFPKY